jgi:malate dehydrogenase
MSIKDVTAMVLGGHGDQMVPSSLRRPWAASRCRARARGPDSGDGRTHGEGGSELVNLLGTSAWYAPGAAAAQMVDAVVLDEAGPPCTAYLEGEYGIDGLTWVCLSSSALGDRRIVELDLDDASSSAEGLRRRRSRVVGVLPLDGLGLRGYGNRLRRVSGRSLAGQVRTS